MTLVIIVIELRVIYHTINILLCIRYSIRGRFSILCQATRILTHSVGNLNLHIFSFVNSHILLTRRQDKHQNTGWRALIFTFLLSKCFFAALLSSPPRQERSRVVPVLSSSQYGHRPLPLVCEAGRHYARVACIKAEFFMKNGIIWNVAEGYGSVAPPLKIWSISAWHRFSHCSE